MPPAGPRSLLESCTPPSIGPFFCRNFISRGIGIGQNKLWLPTPDPKPTPAWLGGAIGAIAREDANPHPGASATRPERRTSRRVAKPTHHRTRKIQANSPASTASTPVAVPDAPAISMPRRRRTLPFAFSRRSLTYARTWTFAVAKATGLVEASAARPDAVAGPPTSRDPPTQPPPAIPHRPCSSPGRRSSPLCGADRHLFYR